MKYRLHTHHSAGHSPIHRLDPRTKLLVTLLYVVLVVSVPPPQLLAFVIYAGLLSWVIALSQVPLSYVLWRACAVFPVTILAACWLPFVAGGPPVSILGGRLELSRGGLWLFAGVAIKSYLGASAAITMISTTPFTSLAWGLRKLGLPRILVDMLTMTHRYLFVLFEEAMRLAPCGRCARLSSALAGPGRADWPSDRSVVCAQLRACRAGVRRDAAARLPWPHAAGCALAVLLLGLGSAVVRRSFAVGREDFSAVTDRPTMPASAINVEGLSFHYPDGTHALENIFLAIEPGESVCLAGPNGAGKSSLLLILAGLMHGSGLVEIGGQAPQTNCQLGLVFQDADDQLFCPTVGEDVAFGPRNQGLSADDVAQRVDAAMRATGLAGYAQRSAHHLSGGEKKRAAIASVLACDPAVLALDEPWANLDARGAGRLTQIVREFPGTRLVTSQDLRRAAEVCQRMIVLDQGRIVADGPMDRLLRDEALLEQHGLEPVLRCTQCGKRFASLQ